MFEITIPVLDEEETLQLNVLKAYDFVKSKVTDEFKIIIADNGSTDKTPEIGTKLARSYDEIEYLKVSKRGVGLALRTSWIKSKADYVGYMDLDLATDLQHLIEVYSSLTNHKDIDVVNGSRLLPNSKVTERKPIRNITSKGFNFIVQTLLGVKLSDGMCGFKFFRREVAQSLIDTGINRDGWFFSTEIIVKALWANYHVKEIGINWTDDENSKVNIKELSKEYLKAIFELRKQKESFKKLIQKK